MFCFFFLVFNFSVFLSFFFLFCCAVFFFPFCFLFPLLSSRFFLFFLFLSGGRSGHTQHLKKGRKSSPVPVVDGARMMPAKRNVLRFGSIRDDPTDKMEPENPSSLPPDSGAAWYSSSSRVFEIWHVGCFFREVAYPPPLPPPFPPPQPLPIFCCVRLCVCLWLFSFLSCLVSCFMFLLGDEMRD